jgi:exoribonuclease R
VLAGGLQEIRRHYQVPDRFPEAVERAAAEAADRPVDGGRVDRRVLPFVTLDPLGSTDLDQAFAFGDDGEDVLLHYAIADVAHFVDRGGVIETEAWKRGVTVYAPDGRAGLYPERLAQGAASLLPDGDRPAVLLTIVVPPDGLVTMRSVERAIVRSRAQLAYETVTPGVLDTRLAEVARRVAVAEDARGASRIEFPEQAVVPDPGAPGGMALRTRVRRPVEDDNATLSLAANLAAAAMLQAAGVGVFRVMADPDERVQRTLHRVARNFGIDWPDGMTLRYLNRRLDGANPRHVAFLVAARRAGGGASYAVADGTRAPWHSAVAAVYAHATAPLRRLADRYVLDVLCELHAGARPSADERGALAALPGVMQRGETVAAHVERDAIDLVEAVTLQHRIGEEFEAAVLDVDRGRATIQLVDPPVRTRIELDGTEPGDLLRVKLVAADPSRRLVEFSADQAGSMR